MDRELTPVFDGEKDLPVRKGWYPSWPKWFGKNKRPRFRRYWNGAYFSMPVLCSESNAETALRKTVKSLYENSELYWCGLTAPYKP